MACYNPLKAYYDYDVLTLNGKPLIRFGETSDESRRLTLPCGQCIGCRLDRSRQWAVRCMHEAKFHPVNSFITLTYNDSFLPPDGSLHKEHFQKFMKRLRFRHSDIKIRFFHCGEYGDQLGRPHYHAIIFGYDFPDKKCFKIYMNRTTGETKYYISKELEELWPYGYNIIGDVTFESCAYVSRYILKKVNGDSADEHYQGRQSEYVTMSRRPGIGYDFYVKYLTDMFPNDIIIDTRGRKSKPPRYYMNLLQDEFPLVYDMVKENRKEVAHQLNDDDFLRLVQREEAKLLQIERLVRPYEGGI